MVHFDNVVKAMMTMVHDDDDDGDDDDDDDDKDDDHNHGEKWEWAKSNHGLLSLSGKGCNRPA